MLDTKIVLWVAFDDNKPWSFGGICNDGVRSEMGFIGRELFHKQIACGWLWRTGVGDHQISIIANFLNPNFQ